MMGQMSGLEAQLKELRTCGETIIRIADVLKGTFSSTSKELTLEDVRHQMAVIARSGFSAEVRALITKYGAIKLSDIDPSQYESLLRDVKALGKQGVSVDG